MSTLILSNVIKLFSDSHQGCVTVPVVSVSCHTWFYKAFLFLPVWCEMKSHYGFNLYSPGGLVRHSSHLCFLDIAYSSSCFSYWFVVILCMVWLLILEVAARPNETFMILISLFPLLSPLSTLSPPPWCLFVSSSSQWFSLKQFSNYGRLYVCADIHYTCSTHCTIALWSQVAGLGSTVGNRKPLIKQTWQWLKQGRSASLSHKGVQW